MDMPLQGMDDGTLSREIQHQRKLVQQQAREREMLSHPLFSRRSQLARPYRIP